MSDTVTNLKVRFGADTKSFKKELESGKAAVDTFSGSAKSSFSKFASLFGVDLDKIGAAISSTKKSLGLLSSGFKGAAESSTFFAAAMRIVKLALVSTGIGAIVVALGALVTYFTKTSEGANFVKRSLASVGAVFRELTDRVSDLGKFLFDAFSKPKETIKDLWEFLKSQLINRITAVPQIIEAAWSIVKGIFKGGLGDAAKDMASAMAQLTTGLDKQQQSNVINYISGVGTAMSEEAKKAWELSQALQNLAKKERELSIVQAERRNKISELLIDARDLDKSDEERLKSAQEAINITKKMAADEIAIETERFRILKEQMAMGKLMGADKNALAEQERKLYDVQTNYNTEIKAQLRLYNSLTKEIEAAAEAKRKERNAMDGGEGLKPLDPYKKPQNYEWKLTKDSKGIESWTKIYNEPLETDKLEASANKIKGILGDLKSTTIDIGAAIADAMNSLAVSFGENLGLLIAGADGAKSMNEILAGVFGDLLVTIGKAAISAGTGFLAVAEMFKIGIASPAAAIAAIAAGIALVAIGTSFKSSVSSAASGSGSFSSAASGGGSYDSTGGAAYSTPGSLRSAPMTINITGTFRAQGKDLVAVIDKHDQVKKIVT